MSIDYDNLLNNVPNILLLIPIAERDKTYVAPSQLQLYAEFMALKMREDEAIRNNPDAIAERVRLIQANLLHDMNLAYSRYYDPNNTSLYDAIVKELLENAERDLNAIPGYAEYKAGIGAPTIGPAYLTDNYQISDDQILRNYNMVNYARNSFSNIGSGAYYMPVDYRNQNAVNSYVNNAKVLANFINDALATAGIGYGINNIGRLGNWTAKGILQAGRLFTPSEYIPGINYYGRLISPGWRGLSTNVGRWADGLTFSTIAGLTTQNAINNPSVENITYAGLSYLPVVSGVKNIFTSIPSEYYLSYFRHPTWKTYYHASNNPFNPNEFLVKANDLGMHVNDDIRAARTFGRKYIYKIRAPRPSAETIDIWGNDWRLLSTDYPYATHPKMFKHNFITSTKDDFLRYQMIKEACGMPSWNLYNTGIHNERPVELNLRSRFPKVDLKQADFIVMSGENLLKLYPDLCPGAHSSDYILHAPRINELAANVLSNAGYNTVKYVNIGEVNKYTPYSYFITNPSMVDVLPKILWNTNNAFSNGYFNIPFMLRYSNNNNEQNNK